MITLDKILFGYVKFKLLLMFSLFYFTGYKIEYKTMILTTNVQKQNSHTSKHDCLSENYSFNNHLLLTHTCYLPACNITVGSL